MRGWPGVGASFAFQVVEEKGFAVCCLAEACQLMGSHRIFSPVCGLMVEWLSHRPRLPWQAGERMSSETNKVQSMSLKHRKEGLDGSWRVEGP